ncbi:aspartate-semialdehyde dehydrogenase [Candidatus Woesearchaeota archaeon]|nr:aspartate-semialdehyde dehydrogenase [Candidatus Woesearchaeota archaeon]
MKKLNVGVLAATGMVGQKYIHLLRDHPWFEVTLVTASPRSAGQTYGQAVQGRWHMPADIPKNVRDLMVYTMEDLDKVKACDFVFSALSGALAKQYEESYANAGIRIVSNASYHRHTEDVPMMIPEINHEHASLIDVQQKNRGWEGFIAVKPNCSLQSYMTPLYALHEAFGVKEVIITTLQAVSGAGYPGCSAFDLIDNTLPHIGGEEEKTEKEPLKIFGILKDGKVEPAQIKISAHCNRVPVIDGHSACVSVRFEKRPTREQILEAWQDFRSYPQEHSLPFAPKQPIIYRDESDRPQPRLDRDADKGMAVTVGRLRECNVFDWRFTALSHNTVRGAAGGAILEAEVLYKKGYFK